MESNQPTMCAGSDPLVDKELRSFRQSDHPPENWLCELPGHEQSQVLKLLDRKSSRVLLEVEGMRELVLSEPDCWRSLTLKITDEKAAEMGSLERVAGFAHKVTVEIERSDPANMPIIARLPQFDSVVELDYKNLSAESSDSDCDVMLALADHFLKIETLKVPSRFIGFEKSFYHALEQKWVNLREVEIGEDQDRLDDVVKGACGFAEGVAESGRLAALRFSLNRATNDVCNFVRNTLMVLANGGHDCLRCLHITASIASIECMFKECLPFFKLNSLTTLVLEGFCCSYEPFTKRFLDVLASMTNLKVLVLTGSMESQGRDMMRFFRSSRFELKELRLTLSCVYSSEDSDLLLALAEAQKNLEKVVIEYSCEGVRYAPTFTGVRALENMPKMNDCQVKCSGRGKDWKDHRPFQSCADDGYDPYYDDLDPDFHIVLDDDGWLSDD